MLRVTIDGFPVTEGTRKALLDNPGVAGALLSYGPEPDQNVRVHVFGPLCQFKTSAEALARIDSPEYLWERDWKPAKPKAKPRPDGLSRTAAALKLIDEEEITPYSAAQQCGVDVSAVYRALARREAKAKAPKCPCCQRPLAAVLEVGA